MQNTSDLPVIKKFKDASIWNIKRALEVALSELGIVGFPAEAAGISAQSASTRPTLATPPNMLLVICVTPTRMG